MFADEFQCDVAVHQVGGQEVRVRNQRGPAHDVIHLECLRGVDFNYYLPRMVSDSVVFPDVTNNDGDELRDRCVGRIEESGRSHPGREKINPK